MNTSLRVIFIRSDGKTGTTTYSGWNAERAAYAEFNELKVDARMVTVVLFESHDRINHPLNWHVRSQFNATEWKS